MLYSIVTLNKPNGDDFDFTVTDDVITLDCDEDDFVFDVDDEY